MASGSISSFARASATTFGLTLPCRARSLRAAKATISALISKCRRRAPRLSLRPYPSVPRTTGGLGIQRATELGKGVVVGINKWDLVEEPDGVMRDMKARLEDSLSQLRGVQLVTCSALTGRGCDKLMPAVLDVYGRWNIRVSTSALNRWLRDAVENHPPPLASGRRVKLRYITQVKARPPTFAAFVSRPEALADSYRRYLVNGLREEFGLDGVPIRLFMRKGKNPYAKK